MLALAPCTGCATVLGTAISPITVPIDAVRLASKRGFEWGDAATLPLAIVFSPLIGFCTGLDTDSRIVDPGWEWPLEHVLRPLRYFPMH
jgi:hypothetical protein